MKKMNFYFACTILIFIAGVLSYSQEEKVDRATVPFSDPSRPGLLKVDIHNGGITIKGYEGKEVIIEAKTRGKIVQRLKSTGIRDIIEDRVRGKIEQELKEKQKEAKTEGMQRIQIPIGTGLEVEEENNVMEVEVSSLKQTVDLIIQVPYSTSLELDAHTNGDIIVENVKGEIEVDHHNGELKLIAISGAVVAHTFNGHIFVTFTEVNPEKPMSFSTWNGDIDVTFPSNVKAKIKMKSERGEIYTDYDIQLDKTPQKVEKDSRKEGGKYKISFEKHIIGTINGGGPEYQFNTYNGDILIRKAK